MTEHRPLDYPVLPVLRADNAEVLIHPDDRKYGALLVGSMGSGKCIGPDDLVLLEGRLIRAEDAWLQYAGAPVFDGEGWWSEPLAHPLTCSLSAEGFMVRAPVTRLYRQRVHTRLRRVRLSDGSELTITDAHQLRGPDGWTNQIDVGDVICSPRVLEWPGRPVDLELVEILAWQISEGCETHEAKRSRRGSSMVSITQSDIAVLEHLRQLALRVGERYGLALNEPSIQYGTSGIPHLAIRSAGWRDFLIGRGYDWGRKSADKSIPDFVMQGDLDAARTFLRAYADAEGSVMPSRRTIELITASRMLCEQVRALLRRFGVIATGRTKHACATNGARKMRAYKRLSIRGESLDRFRAEIGFGYSRKQAQLDRMLAEMTRQSNLSGVYTNDVLSELKEMGLPFSWITDSIHLEIPRLKHAVATSVAESITRAADRLAARDFVTPGARGPNASRARIARLAALDSQRIRDLGSKLAQRIKAEVVYLTVEEVEEFDYDGWVYDFEVPEHHNYVAGGMLAHNTAALLRMVLNDVRDENAAPIIIDPKSELSRLCLRLIPPECGKRVWFLDLGRPAFGMSPLRRAGERPLAIEAAALAENVVAALSDISENQIFQSSRRYLYHAVIGALALAERAGRRPKFEDVYSLLRPAKNEFRDKVAEACADQPDLDQTAEFFRSELPDDLKMAGASVTQRLDAPRNKISGLTGVPPLRRFFNHPTDIPLREIIEARDVLIVDANMAAIGTENSRACMHFLLRMLHTQLQRQIHLPESERPRVPLLVDEAHYVADGENVVDQIATHRAAGLEVAFGLQYLAQLGSGSADEEKIRKGVVNLLQSRFLFRLGDARDAEEATRIAMAVYATMIRDDPDSRARLRVTPEQALNFPNFHCLASWIAGGTRIPSFIGQTYAWPRASDQWERWHLERMREQVGPYPEDLESTLEAGESERRPDQLKDENGGERPGARQDQHASKSASRSALATSGAKREVRVDVEPPAPPPNLAESPVRRVVGKPAREPARRDDQPAPESVRELAFFDRINEVGEADQLTGVDRLPRLYDADYAILKLLDRAGLAPRVLIGRATMPERTANAINDRLVKLYRHGLIAQHTIGVRQRTRSDGALPLLYSITRRGLQVAQARKPAPAISPKREWRPIEQRQGARVPHDLHALSWTIAFHRTIGKLATDNWRTPRYVTGRYPVPQIGSGHRRHPVTVNEIPLPEGQALIDIQITAFGEVKPDVSLEIRIDAIKLTFDLLVELDLTERPSYNREKLLAYDAFLCGWCLEHPRYKTLGTRPVVVFVCRDDRFLLGCAKVADEVLTGRVGPMGAPADQWYYAARQHLFFARETDIHASRISALALPSLPPDVRERLGGERGFALTPVALLPDPIVKASHA